VSIGARPSPASIGAQPATSGRRFRNVWAASTAVSL
jgi:hypothetical protein